MAQDDEEETSHPQDASSGPSHSDDVPDKEELINLQFGELGLEDEFRRRKLLDAAVGYAQRGWRVIPLCWVGADGTSCGYSGHKQCASPGKRAILEDWPNRATNDPVKAGQWWRKVKPNTLDTEEWYPLASIGVVLGEGSGIFALDVDPQHGGFVELERQEQRHSPLPATRVQQTGGEGAHYIFEWPGFHVYNLKPWGKDAGLDIKGDGGYIVMPPSRSHKGEYSITPQMADAPIAAAPEWLLEPLRTERDEQRGSQITTADALPNKLIAKYVESAMKREHYGLAACPSGGRNDQLYSAAKSLGSLAAHGFVSKGEVYALLVDAGNACNLIQDDGKPQFDATFRSGWNAGLRNPRDLSGVGNLADQQWPRLPFDEFALGDRLVIYFGDRLRWVDSFQAWMSYTSGVWERKTMTEAERYAERMIRLLPVTEAPLYSDELEPGTREDTSPREQFLSWLKKQKTHSKKVNVAKIARDSPVIRAEPEQFDAEPRLLNVANGVVDLETMDLTDHNPDLMLTMRSPVAYSPGRDCPEWMKFLRRVQPDPEMRAYVQRIAGYSATGLMSEQVFFLHQGSGANGKSVFHELMGRVLGAYSQTVPVETLMDSTMDRVPNDIARMAGRRYLVASETKAGKFLDEPKLKLLTGGDAVAARFMRGEFFEFRPTGKVHLTTNHLPRLSDDSATWRRIRQLKWEVTIPEAEREGGLAERLFSEEASGILNWIIQGAFQWFEIGLQPPQAAIEAQQEYKLAEDELQLWLDERCHVSMERAVKSQASECSNLRMDYNQWARENGYAQKNQRNFTEALMKKGYNYERAGRYRGFPQIVPKLAGMMPASEKPSAS